LPTSMADRAAPGRKVYDEWINKITKLREEMR
jgi:hypothetical protein